MSKQDLFDQLDHALNAVLTSRDAQSLPQHPSLRPLVSLGDNLRSLPRPEFKAVLRAKLTAESHKNQLNNEASPGSSPETTLIPAHTNPIREGFHTITPYLHPRSADRLIAFLTEAFGAELIVRVPRSDGSVMHGCGSPNSWSRPRFRMTPFRSHASSDQPSRSFPPTGAE